MSLRPRAPAPCAAAACCASSPSFGADRLAAVLAAGMRLGPTPAVSTGVVFTIEPDLQTCSICFEPMSGAVSKDNPFIVLECQHAFHIDCMSQWTQEREDNMTCPVCRVAITQKDVDDIIENEIEYETVPRTRNDGVVENWTAYYRKDRLMRQELDGSTKKIEYYAGAKGEERIVRVEHKGEFTDIVFYEGDAGSERKVRKEMMATEADGGGIAVVVFYEGEKDSERQVRTVHYDGKKDAERKVKVEYPEAFYEFYEGQKGEERLVRKEFKNGNKGFYEGEKGAERMVRAEFPSDEKRFYEGERGAVRLVRVEYSNGQKQFYEGERGAERKVRTEYSDGWKEFFEGEKGAERLVRVEPRRLDNARAKRLRTRALVGRSGPTL